MNPLKFILLTAVLFFLMPFVSGQDVTQPSSPQLDFVTVDPYTGYATIKWLPSVSADVGSYVVYTYSNGIAHAVDTIRSPYILEYTDTGSLAGYLSITYVVAAIDSSLNISPLSNPLSTIYMAAKNDSCKQRIELTWTPYTNTSHPADRYDLWVSTGGASAVLYESLAFTDNSYFFNNYNPATRYCFYITASDNTGALSSSNQQCVISGSETAPSWIRTDAVAVENGTIVVKGSYDQATDMLAFITERFKSESQEWTLAGTAAGSSGNVAITVTAADTNRINLYRITVLNNCGREVVSSPPARNIVLSSSTAGPRIDLKWNSPLPAGSAYYSVWRDIGHGWEEAARQLSDTLWSEDYTLFATDVSSATVSYFITATDPEVEADVPPFRSNITLIQATENIFMPNAFTPDDDGQNDIFIPIISFTPSKYEFRIYNRTGVLLFQTSNPGTGWDGLYNDNPMPSGVYLWSLKLTTPSGRSEQRTGTVTILP